jgi:hypothetical protein
VQQRGQPRWFTCSQALSKASLTRPR